MTEILKTARSSYGDWKGTAAADEHQTTGHRTPYEVVGLDPDEWWIVGFDFQGADLTRKDGLYVYAVRKDSMGITNWDAIQLHGEANVLSRSPASWSTGSRQWNSSVSPSTSSRSSCGHGTSATIWTSWRATI
ncbi:hypothetical protein [Pseudarthrobacter chlorophenolicus]|uniref:hypothetical protein n=1 Tax=Pseudarthrobacter chlorophenolicus TaxID=85085 RepID=UPI0008843106|nr:hypothetical protein [Pseudarthrobacter chlorophenolicus]SDQ21213.1 hypothetical protein SAMN04489738_0773 [Pseudarthrobacter chlorophenolicus]